MTAKRPQRRDATKGLKGIKPLSVAIKQYLKRSGISLSSTSVQRMKRVWRDVVGDEIAAKTRLASVRKGVLTVDVDSSSLLAELAAYSEEAIREALNEKLGEEKIWKIKFKMGQLKRERTNSK